MISQFIWWATVALEALLLARAVQGKWVAHYPVFFGYISYVLLQSVVRHVIHAWNENLYFQVYWITEFVAILVGSAVVFEIYRVGLEAFPGTARMARNVLAVVFILACTKAMVDAWNDPRWWPTATAMDIERYLRVFQVLSIAALVVLFLFYSVPFGRNLKGILSGYSLFILLAVSWMTIGAIAGTTLHEGWRQIFPALYLAPLCLWVVNLWSYQPQPAIPAVKLEDDYQKIAAATRRRLQEARGYLGKATPL
jgi:hypothetical protein